MPNNKRPRKKCKPLTDTRSPRFDPLYLLGKVPKQDTRDIWLRLHHAHENMKSGNGTLENYEAVILAIDIGREIALGGVGYDEYAEHWVAAFDGFIRLKERGDSTGKYLYEGSMIKHVDVMVQVHFAQLQAITMRQLHQAEASLTARRNHHKEQL